MPSLSSLCDQFEEFYSDLYEIKLPLTLSPYVSFGTRDQVLINTSGEEIELAVTLSSKVITDLESQSPFEQLNGSNLGSFFIFVEELSHLVQIACLADANSEATLLGLESIGEVDKLVVSAALLELQTKKPHLTLMKNLLLHHCTVKGDRKLYEKSPRAILNQLFAENRPVLSSSSWRQSVKRFKKDLLKAS